MKKIIIHLVVIISVLSGSCRKTTTSTGTSGTSGTSGTVTVSITDTKGTSTVTIKPHALLGYSWTGGNGIIGNEFPAFHANGTAASEEVMFALNFEPQIKSYPRGGVSLDSKDDNQYSLVYSTSTNYYYPKDGTLTIKNVILGFDSVEYRRTYTISGIWSGTLFDSLRNSTVKGVINWNNAKFD
jgi:hypothetical protein